MVKFNVRESALTFFIAKYFKGRRQNNSFKLNNYLLEIYGQPIIALNKISGSFDQELLKDCKNLLEFTDGAVYICMSSSELQNM